MKQTKIRADDQSLKPEKVDEPGPEETPEQPPISTGQDLDLINFKIPFSLLIISATKWLDKKTNQEKWTAEKNEAMAIELALNKCMDKWFADYTKWNEEIFLVMSIANYGFKRL